MSEAAVVTNFTMSSDNAAFVRKRTHGVYLDECEHLSPRLRVPVRTQTTNPQNGM